MGTIFSVHNSLPKHIFSKKFGVNRYNILIGKILQPNKFFRIIRCILTQTNPSKRNCHGNEPSPIPTRIVLTYVPIAIWHRRAMGSCTGSVTLAGRLPLLPLVAAANIASRWETETTSNKSIEGGELYGIFSNNYRPPLPIRLAVPVYSQTNQNA